MSGARSTAVVDIGSNSVRLVVYSGSPRAPTVIFNEKVLAGLGEKLAEENRISGKAQKRALAALERFSLLTRHMGVEQVRTVATAAVRDATNGTEFVGEVEKIGLRCEVLAAEEEARLAGLGVLSGIPDADGIVGDLGGGSLDLADVSQGRVNAAVSLPLGVFRVTTSGEGESAVAALLRSGLDASGIGGRGRKRALYLVGGSWRALARLDMVATDFPLPILQEYRMPPNRPRQLRKLVSGLGPKLGKAIPVLTGARVPSLPAAAMILSCLSEQLQPSELVVSSYGIREGLLFAGLTEAQRQQDPLVEAAREASLATRRLEEHGEALDEWIDSIFDDPPHLKRLRLAACIIADATWQAHPDFRAERSVELALHGSWVSVAPADRVLIAQALYSNFSAQQLLPDDRLLSLCDPADVERAYRWGLAMRLGQRLCAGAAAALRSTKLLYSKGILDLWLSRERAALAGEAVQRRLVRLAQVLEANYSITIE